MEDVSGQSSQRNAEQPDSDHGDDHRRFRVAHTAIDGSLHGTLDILRNVDEAHDDQVVLADLDQLGNVGDCSHQKRGEDDHDEAADAADDGVHPHLLTEILTEQGAVFLALCLAGQSRRGNGEADDGQLGKELGAAAQREAGVSVGAVGQDDLAHDDRGKLPCAVLNSNGDGLEEGLLDGLSVLELEAGQTGLAEGRLAVQQEGAEAAADDLRADRGDTGADQIHAQSEDERVAADDVDDVVQNLHEHGGAGVAHGIVAGAVQSVDDVEGDAEEHDVHVAARSVQNFGVLDKEGQDLRREQSQNQNKDECDAKSDGDDILIALLELFVSALTVQTDVVDHGTDADAAPHDVQKADHADHDALRGHGQAGQTTDKAR